LGLKYIGLTLGFVGLSLDGLKLAMDRFLEAKATTFKVLPRHLFRWLYE